LPLLTDPGAEKLWDLLVEKTYRGTKDYNSTSHDSFKAVTKLILGRGSPNPDTYERAEFKLSPRRARVIRNQRDRLLEFVDKKKKWPAIKDYVSTATKGIEVSVENLGLRLGTYSGWRSSKLTGVKDRDAHHTVQYLLLEYFANSKGRKPFPHLKDEAYPGIDPIGRGRVNSITNTGAKKVKGARTSISVNQYFEDRGGAMTTVYLARHTHQSNIHYRSEPPDEDETGRATQGNSIDAAFEYFLGDYGWVKSKDAAVVPVLRALAKNATANKNDEPVPKSTSTVTQDAKQPITVNRTSKAIFTAAQKTYKDMWDEMKPKLKRGLEVQELGYYNTIAKLRGMTEMKTTDLTTLLRTVTSTTEAEIGTKAGFKA
jgi:hypothetical protein